MTSRLNNYSDLERSRRMVAEGNHRQCVGGFWEELGVLQLQLLQHYGLKPPHRLLDIGCGCLRAGVHFIRYLDAGNYYGTDISADLLRAGYDVEVQQEGLTQKIPRQNLMVDGEFRFDQFSVKFDYALAQSLFTHLPVSHLTKCLANLKAAMTDGGKLFATFFLCDDVHDCSKPLLQRGTEITTYTARDPYHYTRSDLHRAAEATSWSLDIVGDWSHPRNQQLAVFSND